MVRARSDIKRELLRRSLDAGYTLTHLRQRGNDLDEIYRRYFEKAGVENENDDQEKQRRFTAFRNRQ